LNLIAKCATGAQICADTGNRLLAGAGRAAEAARCPDEFRVRVSPRGDVRQLISLRSTELLCNDELYRYLFNYTGYPFGRMECRHRQGAANPRMWDAVQLTDTLLVGMLEAAPDAAVCLDAEVTGARS
jgi:hypothetical protein